MPVSSCGFAGRPGRLIDTGPALQVELTNPRAPDESPRVCRALIYAARIIQRVVEIKKESLSVAHQLGRDEGGRTGRATTLDINQQHTNRRNRKVSRHLLNVVCGRLTL